MDEDQTTTPLHHAIGRHGGIDAAGDQRHDSATRSYGKTAGALNSLRQELQVEGKLQLFEQLKTFLAGGRVLPSYDDASARTGLARATVKTHVHRLRQRYREIVRCEIARTVSAPHEIDEELRYLCNVLAQAA